MASRKTQARKLPNWVRDLLAKPDDEIGRILAHFIEFKWDEQGVRNELYRRRERVRLREQYLDAAITTKPPESLDYLAYALALAGDYSHAGKAWRLFVLPRIIAESTREIARANMRLTKLGHQIANETKWHEAGLKIRESERGWPVDNDKLAKAIAREVGGNFNTIRLLVPVWDLDKQTWRARKRVKSKSISRRPKSAHKIK
jgi:hypothetical protein